MVSPYKSGISLLRSLVVLLILLVRVSDAKDDKVDTYRG